MNSNSDERIAQPERGEQEPAVVFYEDEHGTVRVRGLYNCKTGDKLYRHPTTLAELREAAERLGYAVVPLVPSIAQLETFVGGGLQAFNGRPHSELVSKAQRHYSRWIAAAQEKGEK